MDRRFFIAGLMAAIVSATVAGAATFQDKIVHDLRLQGYGDVFVQTTFLGRVRIRATKGDDQREIVLNPRTGEVLRDVLLGRTDQTGTASKRRGSTAHNESSSGSGSSGSGSSSSSSENEKAKEKAEKEREREKEKKEKQDEREREDDDDDDEKENDD